MSSITNTLSEIDVPEDSIERFRQRIITALFGDILGFGLFCATLFVFGLIWRQTVFINDNYTLANTLVAVAEGHLDIRQATFGSSIATPGTVESGGQVYGRNYGQIFLALPVLYLLRAVALVADIRILIAGVWSLLLLWSVRSAATYMGQRRRGTLAGSGVALLLFGVNVALATELPDSWLPVLALQLVSAVAAAFVPVLIYRLVAELYGSRVAVAAGVTAVLGTGLGFWATIPKRHALLACIGLIAVFALYRSRQRVEDGDPVRLRTGYRAGAYACTGFAAWVAAPAGIILGLTVVTVDFATGGWTALEPRSLAIIGIVLVAAFIPFAATNVAISGNPVEPPRQLQPYSPAADSTATSSRTGVVEAQNSGGTPTPTGTPTSTPGATSSGSGMTGAGGGGPISAVLLVVSQFVDGAVVAVTKPKRVLATFVRSGYAPRGWLRAAQTPGTNLSVLESAPVFGTLAGVLTAGGRRVQQRIQPSISSAGIDLPAERRTVVDLFAVIYSLLFVLAYMPRLPIHATVTVRYLVPIYPVLVYAVVRLAVVRRAIANCWALAAWTYAGTVLLGGQLLLTATQLVANSPGEAMQMHAVVDLSLALLLVLWVVPATLLRRRDGTDLYDRLGAVLLALAVGATTVFIILATVAHFSNPTSLLPLVPEL